MQSGKACRMGESSAGGIDCLVVVVVVIGALFLFQRDGGKVFGPGGFVAPPAPPPPPLVTGLKSHFEGGIFSHDLQLTNGSSEDLKEVDLTITLFRDDGQKPVVKKFWAKWAKGEVKTINVPSHPYQRLDLVGTAWQNLKECKINDGWTYTWKGKQ